MDDDLTGFSYRVTDGEMHGHTFTVVGRTTQQDIDDQKIMYYRWPLEKDGWNVRLDDGPRVYVNTKGDKLRDMRATFNAGRRAIGVEPIGGYNHD